MTPWHRFSSGFRAKILTNSPESLRRHQKTPSNKIQKRQIFRKSIFIGKLFRQKSTWYGSSGRSAKWKILVHWSSFFHRFKKKRKKLDFHDQNIAFYLKFLISTPVFPGKSPFSFGALFDLFLVEHISIYIYIYIHIYILISEIWLNGPRSAGWLNGPRSKQALKCGGTCLRRKFMAEKWQKKDCLTCQFLTRNDSFCQKMMTIW